MKRIVSTSAALLVVNGLLVGQVWRVSTDVMAAETHAAAPDPWTSAQTVEPAVLARVLGEGAGATRPAVVCVGFPTLYRGGHVPGAVFHGPTSNPEGLADLKRWAEGIARTTPVVLYCGCCPFAECPNIRPAFSALRDAGFTNVRVLVLPNNFGTDWAGKGFPVAR